MKKMLAWLLSLSMLLCMVPAVGAEEDDSSFIVGETEHLYAEDASGDGWSYDENTLTMTMDGISGAEVDVSCAPEGFQIKLAENSVNELSLLTLPGHEREDYFVPVSGEGTLRCIYDVYGSLQVDGGTVDINWITGSLKINGGDVTIASIKAAPCVVVNGGSLTVEKLDTYAFEQYGGMVKAGTMTNCNGSSAGKAEYIFQDGIFILDDSNMAQQSELGAFHCLIYNTKLSSIRRTFNSFAESFWGADGKPLQARFIAYDENGETLDEIPSSYRGNISVILCNSDGTPAHHAEHTPALKIAGNAYPFEKDSAGDGWSYDAAVQTLTLDGISMGGDPDNYSEDNGIDLSDAPEGIQIALASGSVNTLDAVAVPDDVIIPVGGEGTLNTGTWGGTLSVNSGNVNVGSMYGSLIVNGGAVTTRSLVYGNLTMNGGTADLRGTKASQLIVINGGDLTIEELDAYAYEQYGGTVRATRMSNCNGIDVSSMKYVLAGGGLILNNIGTEYEEWDSVFSCVAQPGSSFEEFRQVLSPFDGTMTDEDGNPVSLKFVGYDENDEQVDMDQLPESYSGFIYAQLFSEDGALANNAQLVLGSPCDHEASWLRSDDDGHWYVCGKCGDDMEDTRVPHSFTTYGPVDYCDCGYLHTEVELNSESGGLLESDVTTEIVELGLKMWLGEAKMAHQIRNTIDYDWEGITLEKIARLQLIAQGEEVPERFTAFGMTYRGEKGADTFSAPENLSGSWDAVKVFILDPVTFAPLADPIEIAK